MASCGETQERSTLKNRMFVDGANYYGCEICGEWVREDEVKRLNDKTLCLTDFYTLQAEMVYYKTEREVSK